MLEKPGDLRGDDVGSGVAVIVAVVGGGGGNNNTDEEGDPERDFDDEDLFGRFAYASDCGQPSKRQKRCLLCRL